MKMLLEAYWKAAVDRVIDDICMRVDNCVIQGLADSMLLRMLMVAVDADKAAALFAQDPQVHQRRAQLLA